ncbi:MAG: ABC transporter permease [Lachnospiraceae bacterium]|nr:ABC transporter permease [Lachnospiraceae bacterium]
MYKWKLYWSLQLKRMMKALPGICLLTVLLTVGLLGLLQAMFLIEQSAEEKQVVRIGIVGDLSDSYLGVGINVLMNMEGIKSMADIRTMEEEEALECFEAGEISAYLIVPDGFIDSILTGENKEIIYVTREEAQGIGGMLVNELVDAISSLVTNTQTNIYTVQTYLIEKDKREMIPEATESLNLSFIGAVLNRMEIYELQELGASNRLSLTGHLFTGILLLLVLLWGINTVSLMVRREHSMLKLLQIKGLGSGAQVMAEVTAYGILQCATLCLVFVCVIIMKSATGFVLPEWEAMNLAEKLGFVCRWIPVVLMVAALQALLYELVTNVVNGVLLQFIMAISMGYLGGCIYPVSFFPKGIQPMAAWSPVGTALRYIQRSFSGQSAGMELLWILLYAVLFMGLHIWKRKCRIAGE